MITSLSSWSRLSSHESVPGGGDESTLIGGAWLALRPCPTQGWVVVRTAGYEGGTAGCWRGSWRIAPTVGSGWLAGLARDRPRCRGGRGRSREVLGEEGLGAAPGPGSAGDTTSISIAIRAALPRPLKAPCGVDGDWRPPDVGGVLSTLVVGGCALIPLAGSLVSRALSRLCLFFGRKSMSSISSLKGKSRSI